MRLHGMFAAGMLLLGACAPALEQKFEASRAVRLIYGRTAPCPARFLGSVQGANAYDLQRAAFAQQAHAVLVDTTGADASPGNQLSGTAIQWTGGSCDK